MSTFVGDALYIENERKAYFLYTLSSRAIPHLADGLKPVQRRLLWEARDGKKRKTAALAGSVMYLHPHAMPDDVASKMASPILNNWPLLEGHGAFGTILDPYSFGASRYTSVKISNFAEKVLLCDIEIIPMTDNYDNTAQEPLHFLPLIPIVLVNPVMGIAGGFACNILAREIEQIIENQLEFLITGEIEDNIVPSYNKALKQYSVPQDDNVTHIFQGNYKIEGHSSVRITQLPYSQKYDKYLDFLERLKEKGIISNYIEYSRDTVDILVKFSGKTKPQDIEIILKLTSREIEDFTVIDFNNNRVLSNQTYFDIIKKFTTWRLQWYITRFERLKSLLLVEIQKLKDVIRAIDVDAGTVAKNTKSKKEFVSFLTANEIVYTDYVTTLPVYRFTIEEYNKNVAQLKDKLKTLKEYDDYLQSESKRKKLYMKELQELLKEYGN